MRRPVPTRHRGAANASASACNSSTAVAEEKTAAYRLDDLRAYFSRYQFGKTIECDQAIFTSIRSPMGEGYRIVAQTPGVTRAEAAQITRCAPSHGGLCVDAVDAYGFLAFTLESGRYCVMYARHAGIEHTARGGHRVHTLAALLTGEQVEQVHCSPVRVLAAMARVSAQPEMPASQCLTPLRLPIATPPPADREHPNLAGIAPCIAGHLMANRPCILSGVPQPVAALELAVSFSPLASRRGASLLAGVSYAPVRGVTISLVEGDANCILRSIQGHGVDWIDIQNPKLPENHPADRWLEFIGEQMERGRLKRLWPLAQRAVPLSAHRDLNRLADLLCDLELAEDSDDKTRLLLHARYRQYQPLTPLESELCLHIIELTTPPPIQDESGSANA